MISALKQEGIHISSSKIENSQLYNAPRKRLLHRINTVTFKISFICSAYLLTSQLSYYLKNTEISKNVEIKTITT